MNLTLNEKGDKVDELGEAKQMTEMISVTINTLNQLIRKAAERNIEISLSVKQGKADGIDYPIFDIEQASLIL